MSDEKNKDVTKDSKDEAPKKQPAAKAAEKAPNKPKVELTVEEWRDARMQIQRRIDSLNGLISTAQRNRSSIGTSGKLVLQERIGFVQFLESLL